MTCEYVSDAVKYLDAAARDSGDGSLRELVLRHLAAVQGVGYAVLAAGERLDGILDAVGETRKQLVGIDDTLAAAFPPAPVRRRTLLAWRLWGRRRAERAWRAEAASWIVGAEDVPVVLQALADAVRLRTATQFGDCLDCVRAAAAARTGGVPDAAADLERCDVHARDGHLSAAYAALRYRLLGGDES